MRSGVSLYTFTKVSLGAAYMLVVFGSSVTRANDIIVCKETDASAPVSGMFGFVLDSTTNFSLGVGGCQEFHNIGAGPHTITEVGQSGVVVTEISVSPEDRRVSFDLNLRTVTATAVDDPTPTKITFTNKTQTGTQGCTPGFWKQDFHFGFWTGHSPTDTVGSVFTGALPELSGETLLDALQGGGGPGLLGKEKILLRAAVAALLNASSSSVSYPFTSAQIITAVNAALATGNQTTINNLATLLDNANNGSGGCPIGGQNAGSA